MMTTTLISATTIVTTNPLLIADSSKSSVNIDISALLVPNQDVVDGDVNQLDEKPNETHHKKANTDSSRNGGEFLAVWLRALLDQMHGVLRKLPEGLDEHLLESFLFSHCELYKRQRRSTICSRRVIRDMQS